MPVARIDETLDMYYVIDDYTDPWKTPEAIVMQHGNTHNGKFWYAWVTALARQYKVVRPDYRGMGQSTVLPPGYEPTPSTLAKDLRVLLDQLGLERVHLVAEHGGGVICMQFAYEYPEGVRSLVLCGSAPANNAGARETLSSLVESGDKDSMEAFARSTMYFRFDLTKADPDMVEWYAVEMGKTSWDSDSRLKRMFTNVDLTGILPEIKSPTLIMVGELTGFGVGPFKEMQSLIPNSELQIFHGARQSVAIMYPDECVNSTLAFLRRISL